MRLRIPPGASAPLARESLPYRSCCPRSILLPPHCRPSAPGYRSAQDFDQRLEAFEIVHWAEFVDMRHHRSHAERSWLKTLVTQQRVQPEQSSAGAMQPVHLMREASASIAVEPVGDQEHDRSLTQQTPRPQPVELGERMTDPGPARPVGDRLGDALERQIDIAVAQVAGDV